MGMMVIRWFCGIREDHLTGLENGVLLVFFRLWLLLPLLPLALFLPFLFLVALVTLVLLSLALLSPLLPLLPATATCAFPASANSFPPAANAFPSPLLTLLGPRFGF